MGLVLLQTFFNSGGNLLLGPTLLMIVLTLVEVFMAFTGIILHSMSRLLELPSIVRNNDIRIK